MPPANATSVPPFARPPVRHATLQVLRELFVLGAVSTTTALAVAVIYGWASPFASGATPRDRLGFTLWMVLCCCLFDFVTVAMLIAHMLRSPTLSAVHATRLLLRRSWIDIALLSGVAVAVVYLLMSAGVPVVEYNLHSYVTTLLIMVGSTRLMFNAITIRRRRQVHAAAAIAVHPVSVTRDPRVPLPLPLPRAKSSSWRRTLRKASSVAVPSALSAIVTTQYATLARQTQFATSRAFLLFCLGSFLLKTLLPIATKLFIAKSHIRNARSLLFMLVAPIMHVEIQMRIAMIRAYNQSTPIYVSSAILNVLEIAMRVVTVAVDMARVNRARRRKDRDQRAVLDAHVSTGSGDGTADGGTLVARVQKIESEFKKWKHEHLRNCSYEILAEMAAEYCSIGVVTLYMVVLHGNRSIDLPASSATSMREEASRQLAVFATQVAFEIVTDVVAIFIEMRAGIPLVDTLQHDRERFLRWVILVVVVNSCGLCLSSLVEFE